jgi:hypothetical protein
MALFLYLFNAKNATLKERRAGVREEKPIYFGKRLPSLFGCRVFASYLPFAFCIFADSFLHHSLTMIHDPIPIPEYRFPNPDKPESKRFNHEGHEGTQRKTL